MHFVTLTTDWNKDDFYTGAVTGAILSSCKEVQVITLSNSIRSYSVSEAAFIVRNSCYHFPNGSVHIIAVGSEPSPEGRLLAAKIDGHYFLTADNGILGLLGDAESAEVVAIERTGGNLAESFPALTCFSKTACRIIQGDSFSTLGTPVTDYKKQVPLRATLDNNTITGTVIYIDSFGNAITNITRELFDRFGMERKFTIYVQSKHYRITRLNRYYSETTGGDLLALFNSIDLLEIAIRNGSARDLLNLNTDSTIRVEFS
ncbi:MAG: SAM-dependent chlorinase/fluorinase [Bacteroidales bacterium]|nr:SAM-dependent chlorinase/fluorinase [Bacteroidales bacterium]MDT8430510.1 SAM-dependent chlorinase/fluorinase [Bacteroidales bacterium]